MAIEKQIKVLIVDDEPDIVRIVRIAMELAKYEVAEASSGEECIEKLETGPVPDLILMDIMMPGISGYQACEKIRSNKKFKDLKIVMLTAKGQKGDMEEGLKAGADDYIVKPFDPFELIETVGEILRR
jgi:CheY-like chemotaxis protein